MSLTKEQIKTAALELNPADREALAEELLLSISDAERKGIDSAWLEEVKRRDAKYKSAGGTARAVDEVVARIREDNRR